MRYFFDTEFIERGAHQPIDLISIGIVAEDGREFYAVSSEFNPADANDWVKANVLPHLGFRPQGDLSLSNFSAPQSLATIAEWIKDFCNPEYYGEPEFWAYFSDYDWVVFCQIFGSMIDLPKGFPMFCRDIKQLACDCGNPELPAQSSTEHNALNDARWNKLAYEFLQHLPLNAVERWSLTESFERTAVLLMENGGVTPERLKTLVNEVGVKVLRAAQTKRRLGL